MGVIKFDSDLFSDSFKDIDNCVELIDYTLDYVNDASAYAEAYYVNLSTCKANISSSKTKFDNLKKWLNDKDNQINEAVKDFDKCTSEMTNVILDVRKNIVN